MDASCASNLDVVPVYASQIKKLGKRICRAEPTLLWASSYTHLLYKAQDPFSACGQYNCSWTELSSFTGNLDAGTVYASQIKKLRKRICRMEPAPLWASSYTPLLCKAQDPFSACGQSSPIVPEQNYRLLLEIWMQDQSMLHRSRNSGREFSGWNQLPCGPVLTPISCTKLKIHSAYADSPWFIFLQVIWMYEQYVLHWSRIFWVEPALWLASFHVHIL